MSYDFEIFRTPPGRDPVEYLDELGELAEEAELNSTPIPDAPLDRLYEEIEELVNDIGSCDRYSNHVSVQIPYHYEGKEAEQIFGALASCLQRARDQGLTVYDPQLGRVINPKQDLPEILKTNAYGVGTLRAVTPMQPPGQSRSRIETRKPWWKFW
jgi:hypothetical protein